jgi:WhiB family redox-sensing transcriptional regulator
MSWMDQALCRQQNPEIFFNQRARSERRAKGICARCSVRTDCLELALKSESEYGVWGGLSGPERMVLLRGSTRTEGEPLVAAMAEKTA